ncbi:MAG: zinc metalloprotease HtpX [Hyphomicrobiaceae bacterium]
MTRRYFKIAESQPDSAVAPEPPALSEAAIESVRGRIGLSPRLMQRLEPLRHSDPSDLALVGLIGLIAAFTSFLLWSWIGVAAAVATMIFLTMAAPHLPPEATMRFYRAEPMDLRHGLAYYRLADELALRAGLKQVPKLFVIPSLTVNAFAAGRPERAAIALTEGLLRKLDIAEVAAVLAHELSHIRNDDLRLMSRADTMMRVMQVMWLSGAVLAIVSLPDYLSGHARMPWLAILALLATPALGNMLQSALSRKREFDADLDAVRLTGNPRLVAAALQKVERYQGSLVEDLVLPSRRIPMPSLLRSHPPTEARLARLERIEAVPQHPPHRRGNTDGDHGRSRSRLAQAALPADGIVVLRGDYSISFARRSRMGSCVMSRCSGVTEIAP